MKRRQRLSTYDRELLKKFLLWAAGIALTMVWYDWHLLVILALFALSRAEKE